MAYQGPPATGAARVPASPLTKDPRELGAPLLDCWRRTLYARLGPRTTCVRASFPRADQDFGSRSGGRNSRRASRTERARARERMRRVPPSPSRWFAYARGALLETAVAWAARRPPASRGLVAALQDFAESRRGFQEMERTKCPPGVVFEPLFVEFYALFSLEEFGDLASGIRNLLSRQRSDRFLSRPGSSDELGQWIAERRDSPAGGAWHNLGSLHVGESARERRWADLASGGVTHVLPSYMCVTLRVFPTDHFRAEMRSLLARDALTRTEFTQFPIPFVRRGYGMSHVGSLSVRQEEWRALWSNVERVVRRTFKELGSEWAREGRIPSIRAFALMAGDCPGDSSAREFWEGVGFPSGFPPPYRAGHTLLTHAVPPIRREYDPDLQALVNGPLALAEPAMDGARTPLDRLSFRVGNELGRLAARLALLHQAHRLERFSTRIRNAVAPTLASQRYSWSEVRRSLKSSARIAALRFDLRRMREESEDARLPMEGTLRPFEREALPGGEKGTLAGDLRARLERRWAVAQRQAEILDSTFHDRVNLALQRRMLTLTVVAAILAAISVVGLVPEGARDAALNAIARWLWR